MGHGYETIDDLLLASEEIAQQLDTGVNIPDDALKDAAIDWLLFINVFQLKKSDMSRALYLASQMGITQDVTFYADALNNVGLLACSMGLNFYQTLAVVVYLSTHGVG